MKNIILFIDIEQCLDLGSICLVVFVVMETSSFPIANRFRHVFLQDNSENNLLPLIPLCLYPYLESYPRNALHLGFMEPEEMRLKSL